MLVKDIIDEDFINYKKISMLIAMPYCDFKCNREYGSKICHNTDIINNPNITIDISIIIDRYLNNSITNAIVFQGLEPFYINEEKNINSFQECLYFVDTFRTHYNCDDDIVFYTGYTEQECIDKGFIKALSKYKNIIIKFGRFIPNQESHYDEILGVKLASNNQYAKLISSTQ